MTKRSGLLMYLCTYLTQAMYASDCGNSAQNTTTRHVSTSDNARGGVRQGSTCRSSPRGHRSANHGTTASRARSMRDVATIRSWRRQGQHLLLRSMRLQPRKCGRPWQGCGCRALARKLDAVTPPAAGQGVSVVDVLAKGARSVSRCYHTACALFNIRKNEYVHGSIHGGRLPRRDDCGHGGRP